MAKCKNCGDSGIIHGSASFCFCRNGIMRHTQHKANIRAQEAAKKEVEERAAREAEKAEQLELEVKTEPRFKPGDWVTWTSLASVYHMYGFVISIKNEISANVRVVWISKDGVKRRVNKDEEFNNIGVHRLQPWKLEPIPNHVAIDLALDKNDREWFEQLTKGVEWK